MDFTFAMKFQPGRAPAGLALWQLICDGPIILRPTSAGHCEPLKKVEDCNIADICKSDFIWRNGKKCLGMFDSPDDKGEAFLAMLLSYPANQHESLISEVRSFVQENFNYRLLYGVSPDDKLMANNLKIHQLANCGAIPPDESILRDGQALFEIFEERA